MSAITLAQGCICGKCDDACSRAPFRPCCGACMVGSFWDPDGEEFASTLRMSKEPGDE